MFYNYYRKLESTEINGNINKESGNKKSLEFSLKICFHLVIQTKHQATFNQTSRIIFCALECGCIISESKEMLFNQILIL